MFFLKLCTNDYVTACILLQDMLLLLKTLLTNPVMAQTLKLMPVMRETQVRSLGREEPLEKKMAIHSSIPAWRIPWIEEPVRLQSTGSQRVGQDCATSLSLSMGKMGIQNFFLIEIQLIDKYYISFRYIT